MIPPTKDQLIELYHRALYIIEAPNRIYEIYPFQKNQAFNNFLLSHNFVSWVLMTSDNPYSTRYTESMNAEKRLILASRLKSYPILRCVGMDVQHESHHEVGFFVGGLIKSEAITIGKEFGQNALLVGDITGQVEVIWLADY